jgi:predicted secreted protein
MTHPSAILVLCSSLAVATSAFAQAMPATPQSVLSLQASATMEVANDRLGVTFSTTREATDAAAVQAGLKQALDAALAEARKLARPGQVDVRAGNFSVHPRYGNRGQVNGWLGSTELVVEGQDLAAIAQLTGRITTLTIARVGYGLSREAREKVEADVAAQAIARYRAKAGEMAKQFGYAGYTIREVNVSTNEPPPAMPMMMRAQAMKSTEDAALPVEPGRGVVTATVSGSVQMK